MSGGSGSDRYQASARWTAAVSKNGVNGGSARRHIVRLIPATITTPRNAKHGYRDGSSLTDVRRQLRAASRALREASDYIDASKAIALAPAGWVRTAWPADVEFASIDQPGKPTNDLDVTAALPALGRWVTDKLGADLALLPVQYTVLGVDFENQRSRGRYCEVQGLFVWDKESGVVHATTKFTTASYLMISSAWGDRLWQRNTIGLLNCHDLATLGQKRREPKSGGRLLARRGEVMKIFAQRPKLFLHIAHTFGDSATWKRNWTGFADRLGVSDFAYATAARFEPWREQEIDRFNITRGVADVRVLLARRPS